MKFEVDFICIFKIIKLYSFGNIVESKTQEIGNSGARFQIYALCLNNITQCVQIYH